MQSRRRPLRKSDLEQPSKLLVEMMQRARHAKIMGMRVRDGLPVLEPPPRIIRKVTMKDEDGTGPPVLKGDFVLKKSQVQFFRQLRRMGNGVVTCVEVQNGLPLNMEFETEPGQ